MSESTGYLPEPEGFATKSLHNFQEPEQWNSMAVVTPVVTSTTFKQESPGVQEFIYGRCGQPNRRILEQLLASLDNGKYGLCWSSGMSAITAVTGLLKTGDHIICTEDIYSGTEVLYRKICPKSGIDVSFVQEDEIEKAIKPNTKLIWVESLSNPTMKVTNIKALSALAHKHNVLLGVDSTFISPYFQRPLDLGADIVMHSISKYINGHSDVIMGTAITNNEELYKQLRFIQEITGGTPAPSDCYQVTRSIKTLSLRMERHMQIALEVAKFLEKHPKVEQVLHPGLPSHPQNALFKQQASGCSGMFSFYIKTGGIEGSRRFLTSLKVVTLAPSLGGPETLAELPYVMSHSYVSEEQKKNLKITDTLIRMSIGLEDAEDIIRDLEQALENV